MTNIMLRSNLTGVLNFGRFGGAFVSIANIELSFIDKFEEKNIILESGNLRQIDNIFKSFENEKSLIYSEDYKEKITELSEEQLRNSKVELYYIKDNNEKIKLKPIYNDKEPIHIRINTLGEQTLEIEKARKLLFSSRNKLFLSLFFNSKNLFNTTFGSVKLSLSEYKYAKDSGVFVYIKDGDYSVSIRDLLKYRLTNNRLGTLRNVYEDTLEKWKSNLLDMSNETLYFYSRELRVLINEYNYRKFPRRVFYNLIFYKDEISSTKNYKIIKNNKFIKFV